MLCCGYIYIRFSVVIVTARPYIWAWSYALFRLNIWSVVQCTLYMYIPDINYIYYVLYVHTYPTYFKFTVNEIQVVNYIKYIWIILDCIWKLSDFVLPTYKKQGVIKPWMISKCDWVNKQENCHLLFIGGAYTRQSRIRCCQ